MLSKSKSTLTNHASFRLLAAMLSFALCVCIPAAQAAGSTTQSTSKQKHACQIGKIGQWLSTKLHHKSDDAGAAGTTGGSLDYGPSEFIID